MSFIRTGLREIGLKIRRQRTRMVLRHEKRLLQKSEIILGREGTSQAANFPELRNEIVALKKLEQEQKEVALRIAQIEEGIKKVEAQRKANAKEQSEAMAKLEAEKKPIQQRRNDAKSVAELSEREVNAVERRIRDNDEADQELLRKLSELQGLAPPPADLEAQTARISARRARLPEERAELVRARLGSSGASRIAKEKLVAAEEELSAIEKNIAKVRAEYEMLDRGFGDNIRAQQDAVRDAKQHHQVVEERKNPAYLNIGRHLASQGIAPPNAPHLLGVVRKRRVAVNRHQQHNDELALLSRGIDKQELRQFYFSVVSVIALLAIILPLVAKSPRKREWLPQQTEAILSINTGQFERDDLPKRWHKDQPDLWQNVWNGLIGPAAHVPTLNLSRDTLRITRAATTSDIGTVREFILIENQSDVSQIIRSVQSDKEFHKRTVSGLAVWEKPDLTLVRVGPSTLAVGSSTEVDELIRVRLGIDLDLEITRQAANLELRFNVPEETARLLLQRIAKTDIASSVAGD